MAPVILPLDPALFGPAEREVARFGSLSARAFRFGSGIAGLRLLGEAGEAMLLPFRGQQVWDARFLGRRLTMGSPFAEPVDTDDYLGSYGAFFLHCGLTAMGNPAPADDHPLHGELPSARVVESELRAGEDAEGAYLELGGLIRQARASSHHYEARPSVRLRAGATGLEIALEVTNLSVRPLPLMYLAHANFRPVEGALLLDTMPDATLVLRRREEDAVLPPGAWRRAVLDDVAAHRRVPARPGADPELVLTGRPVADPEGWAHAMQLHPDGSADVLSHRPGELPAGVRWLTQAGDMDALGLLLPATGAPDGRVAATARGEVLTLPPGGRTAFHFRAGALPPEAAARMRARIESVRAGAPA